MTPPRLWLMADGSVLAVAPSHDPALLGALQVPHSVVEYVPAAVLDTVTAERDEAQSNYQWMVARAAAQPLDGYRELGAWAAAAENALDGARRELAEVTAERDLLRERIARALARADRRWSEWGSRAQAVWEILEPDEDEKEITTDCLEHGR